MTLALDGQWKNARSRFVSMAFAVQGMLGAVADSGSGAEQSSGLTGRALSNRGP